MTPVALALGTGSESDTESPALRNETKREAVITWKSIIGLLIVNFLKIRCLTPAAADTVKSFQSCLTLCDPIDGSPPGCPVPGILQARTK